MKLPFEDFLLKVAEVLSMFNNPTYTTIRKTRKAKPNDKLEPR